MFQVLTLDRWVLHAVYWREPVLVVMASSYICCALGVSFCWAEMVRKVAEKNVTPRRGIFDMFQGKKHALWAFLIALFMVRTKLKHNSIVCECLGRCLKFIY